MKTHFFFFLLASTLWFQDVVWSTPVPGAGLSKAAGYSKQRPNWKPKLTGLTPLRNANANRQIPARPRVTISDTPKNKANFGTTTQLARKKKSSKVTEDTKIRNKQKATNSIQNPPTTAKWKGSKGKGVPKKKTAAKFVKKLPLPRKSVPIIDNPTSDYIVQDETGKGTVTLTLKNINTCLQQGAKINNLSPRYPGHGRMPIGGGKGRYPTEIHGNKHNIPSFLANNLRPGEVILHHPLSGSDFKIKPHDRPHGKPAGPHRCFFAVKGGKYRFLGVGTHYGAPPGQFTEGTPKKS
ncbi:hypothetical protein PspLS_10141 [Pyricularia sp. CBS 133598]|nr:hypothetical protein PspLS_10141 [Pyricularia sp. CBS 133598]